MPGRAERRLRLAMTVTALLGILGLAVSAALAQSPAEGVAAEKPSSSQPASPAGVDAKTPDKAPGDGPASGSAPAPAPAQARPEAAPEIESKGPQESKPPVEAPFTAAPPQPAVPPPPPAVEPGSEAASPDAAQSASPPETPAAEAAPAESAQVEPSPVRVGGRDVYVVRVAQGSVSVAERARAAEQAIRKAVDNEKPESVRIESLGDTRVIYAGSIPLLHLTSADAEAAGDGSLGMHADKTAGELREVISTEQKRSAIATTIFSFSLALLLALAALLLLRKTSEFTARVRDWVTAHRENIPGIKLQSLEVVDAATIRSAVALGVEVSKWLLRLGIVYLWLLLTFSLFDATREYTQDLTGIVLTPLSSLMARIAKSLPVVVVALIAIAAVALLVRFVDLFFSGVARGETKLTWLSPDLAAPTSVLLRFGIVVGSLIFAAPVVTGDAEGALGKIGVIVLAALGLSSTPILASSLAGVGVLYGRRLRVGDFVVFGGQSGRVVSVSLLEVRLEDADGHEVRVPHLLSFVHSTRVLGPRSRTSIELCVADYNQETCEILRAAAAKVGDRTKVEVLAVERDAVRYRISIVSARPDSKNALFFSLAGALEQAGVPLSGKPHSSRTGAA